VYRILELNKHETHTGVKQKDAILDKETNGTWALIEIQRMLLVSLNHSTLVLEQ